VGKSIGGCGVLRIVSRIEAALGEDNWQPQVVDGIRDQAQGVQVSESRESWLHSSVH
jgi:hypothetical protein